MTSWNAGWLPIRICLIFVAVDLLVALCVSVTTLELRVPELCDAGTWFVCVMLSTYFYGMTFLRIAEPVSVSLSFILSW